MSEAAGGKRKRKDADGVVPVAAARRLEVVVPPKRYQPPPTFKQIKDKPLVAPETLEDTETEVWLIQLPPQLDPSSFDGVTWKVRTQAADGELGHLQTPQGDSYSAVADPAALARQVYIVSPSPNEGQRSLVRKCTRHVSFVKRWPKADEGGAELGLSAVQLDQRENDLAVSEGATLAEGSTKKKKKKKKTEVVQT